MVMLKLFFQPGIDSGRGDGQTVAYSNRALSVMPAGRCRRMWSGLTRAAYRSGYLVSRARAARRRAPGHGLFRVRPMFSGLAGVLSPRRSAANRTIVVNVDPTAFARKTTSRPRTSSTRSTAATSSAPRQRGRSRNPDDGRYRSIPWLKPAGAAQRPVKLGENVYIRDWARLPDATDIPVGYALVTAASRYLPVVKQAAASTLTVVNAVTETCRGSRQSCRDVKVSYQFDESPIVYRPSRAWE